MRLILIAALAGLLFGIGLILSGMGNPAKVQNFLDVFGHWDPSLALVMAGAIGVALLPFAWAKRHSRTPLGCEVQLPQPTQIDRPLVLGAALFGVGWGLAGFCPGPALMNLSTGATDVLIFVAAMLAGMWGYAAVQRRP